MFRSVIMLMVAMSLSSCTSSRNAEAKAYSAGCSAGITEMVKLFGFGAKEDIINEHCDKEGRRYVGTAPVKDEEYTPTATPELLPQVESASKNDK